MRSFTVMVEIEDMITVEAENEDEAIEKAKDQAEMWSSHDTVRGYVMHSEDVDEGEDE
jgi:hypothetical protein